MVLDFGLIESGLFPTSDALGEGLNPNPGTQIIAGSIGEGNITLNGWNRDTNPAGAWVVSLNDGTSRLQSYTATTDAAQLTWKAYLDAGTYTLQGHFLTESAGGITVTNFDGKDQATWDTYSVGNVENVRFAQADIVIAVAGLQTITMTTTGKNGASAGFQINFSSLNLYRTG